MKTSRFRRVTIVVATLIVVLGAGVFLVRSTSTPAKDSWWGKWSGTIAQPDSPLHSWTFTMSLHDTNGEFIGSYVESSLKCGGSLSKIFADSSKLELIESVTIQPPSGTPWFCAGGPIQIERTGANSATYSWDGGVAHGVIRR